MGSGIQVEKRRAVRLSGLFWRYLLSTAAIVALICLVWLFLIRILINMGVILPANTGANHLEETAAALRVQERFEPQEIPFYYRWALLEADGTVLESNMERREIERLGERSTRKFFYPQYDRMVELGEGRRCLLRYDYAVYYADPELQKALPDFQITYLGILLLLLLLVAFLQTRRYVRLLRRDAETIVLACDAVRRGALHEVPGQAKVRELQTALHTIDVLRQELATSLKRQWAAEQERSEALAALAHDLRTPLTVIGGNAELLCEDHLSEEQRKSAEAILRSARHAEEYLYRLRRLTAGELLQKTGEPVPLARLVEECAARGRDLCAAEGIEFVDRSEQLPELLCPACGDELIRAVENLIGNAVRYTPSGKTVTFAAQLQEERLIFGVWDSGPGFSAEALARAGHGFYTEDDSRPQEGHMGMGLYFASSVSRRCGGGLKLENTAAGGHAEIWLPVK